MPTPARSEPREQQATEAIPLDLTTIDTTTSKVLSRADGRLDLSELAELETILAGHIALLLPYVAAESDHLRPRSGEWYRQKAHLRGIERQVQQGLGDGVLSAHVQVRQLARDCQWLLERHQEISRDA
ncbi:MULTISPECIES: DUF6415 family natural product biosynthesis protein [Streptomyces]|uniref:DUF6415 family natural product biosynthesis protein n=1 Tax=Streptomyces TaxID=1883 RepID=UPI0011803679|nr:DUF6415 family natural product biosynthesis protein [Streptomyces kasugaensis]WSK10365.1 DUF6415 family natural product biosynthesis protein [Streptomyces celluloflavus]WSK17201.1 DUF6415 family natural product biosynthesis protein [Streptomyces celluloflavus]